MARAGRIAGAILVETEGECFLVGQTKEPCDWAAHGFLPPRAPGSSGPWLVKLEGRMLAPPPEPRLVLPLEGPELARALVHRFVIERNGSVSERLWRLVIHRGDPDADDDVTGDVDARWLTEMPDPLWQVVRDTVLRCL